MEEKVNYFGLGEEERKNLDNFIVSICDQLFDKTITIDEAFASIKYEFTVAKPVENLYGMVLEIFKNLYEHLIIKASEEIKEISKLIDHNHDEFYHKLNVELMKLSKQDKCRGVFWSEPHYEAFLHVLKSFLIEEHNKTLFMGFFREYGGNKVLMRCNEKKWREWVNEHYLIKGEDSSKRWNECPQHHYTRKQIRQSQKTYKDPNIFKQPHARNK